MSIRSTYHIQNEISEKLKMKEQIVSEVREICNKRKLEIRSFTHDDRSKLERFRKDISNINEEINELEKELREKNYNYNNNTEQQMEKRNFSLLNAIRAIAENRSLDPIAQAVVLEGQNEMRSRSLSLVGQIQLPSNYEERAITVQTEGQDVVATNLMDVMGSLKAKNVLVKAGARVLENLRGDVQFPLSSSANCSWEGETTETPTSDLTFTHVKLSPKRLSCVVGVSKQFLLQDSASAEAVIREEILSAINSKLEKTVLSDEQGSNTKPEGLFYNGGAPLSEVSKFADITNLEAEVEDANVDGNVVYLLSPKAKAGFRNMAKGDKNLVYENGAIDGTESMSTSNIKDKNFAYGDFSNVVIANWGNLDLTVDSISKAAQGLVMLVVNFYCDVKVLRNHAIKVAKLK
jgi:phage capsid family|nr:MAG TPA: major capsid protein [Caudoviricetes sp.]